MAKQIHAAPSGPDPIGPYSIAAEAGGLVFLSGQVAINPETNAPMPGGTAEQTRRVMDNIGLILSDLGLSRADIVKTTVYLADIQDFPLFNDIYGEYFDDDPPARTTIQAGALPGGYAVEIEVIAAR